ncbi:SLC13 family permease [Brevibacterium sp. CT2-23B]|uniref:SLC13 family permease n=1 Tax=Brevibacterium sp. CT2-23B TaxID=2729630 RepID=UPI0015532D67|nr:SLC13 family permease [Brevibacterium sp. CT2-23B]
MTTPQLISLILLVLILVGAVWKKINIGILSLLATFVLFVIVSPSPEVVYNSFPANLVVLIIGVSLMFSHLELSGAIHWIINGAFRIVGERKWLIPWVGFALGGFLSTVGVFGTGPVAILVPIIAFISVKYPGTYLINALGVIMGSIGLGMSPLNPTGATISHLADNAGASYPEWSLWAVAVIVTAVALAALQIMFARLAKSGKALAEPKASEVKGGEESSSASVSTAYAVSSIIGLLLFVLCVIAFGLDVGLTSMAVAAVLQLIFHPAQKDMLSRVPWGATLLIGGLLTYLGLLESIGTIDSIQSSMSAVGSGAVLLLVLAYLTAVLCNVESSALGVLSLTMPLAFGFFGDSPEIFWIVAAIAVPSGLMVMNPIHIAGTLVIANAQEDRQNNVFRIFLTTSLCLTAVAPGLLSIIPMTLGV